MTDHAQPTHVLDWPELEAWLAEYGLDAKTVVKARIVLGRDTRGLAAWLDVEWYKLDGQGQLYVDPERTNEAAKGHSSIPLHSWPPLRPIKPQCQCGGTGPSGLRAMENCRAHDATPS